MKSVHVIILLYINVRIGFLFPGGVTAGTCCIFADKIVFKQNDVMLEYLGFRTHARVLGSNGFPMAFFGLSSALILNVLILSIILYFSLDFCWPTMVKGDTKYFLIFSIFTDHFFSQS